MRGASWSVPESCDSAIPTNVRPRANGKQSTEWAGFESRRRHAAIKPVSTMRLRSSAGILARCRLRVLGQAYILREVPCHCRPNMVHKLKRCTLSKLSDVEGRPTRQGTKALLASDMGALCSCSDWSSPTGRCDRNVISLRPPWTGTGSEESTVGIREIASAPSTPF